MIMEPKVTLVWWPAEDITVYELALLMRQASGIDRLRPAQFQQLPATARRHFQIIYNPADEDTSAWVAKWGVVRTVTAVSASFETLKAALQADPGYAWTWHCNIAMAIYDESHPQCICEILNGKYEGHRPDCAIVRAHNARHFQEHALSHDFCNNAAARFMNVCFGVDTTAMMAALGTVPADSGSST